MSISMLSRRRGLYAAATASLLVLAATLTTAGPAIAEVGASTPTVQATAANAAWLAYAPPPTLPGMVCLVDSGVDINPDTESVVVGSHELYPQTGPGDEIARLSPPVDGHPDGHGSLMAMLIAAPLNGWGTVGIAPKTVRVYNMKGLANGSTEFHDEVEAEAITDCSQLQEGPDPTLSVINLSLGGESVPDQTVVSEAEDAIVAARKQGIAVVAASGNTGGPLTFPASYSATIAVGAADAGAPGALCSFSARAEKVVLAPGCDSLTGGIEGAWQDTGAANVSQGTSQAGAIYSAILAALRAYAPTLTLNQAEACMTSTLVDGEVDAAAAFHSCGLEAIVKQGSEAEPKPSPPPAVPAGAAGAAGQQSTQTDTVCVAYCGQARQSSTPRLESFERACAQPRIASARRAGQSVRVEARSKAPGCLLQARIRPRHARRWMPIQHHAARTLDIPIAASIQVRFASASGLMAPSAWVTVSAR